MSSLADPEKGENLWVSSPQFAAVAVEPAAAAAVVEVVVTVESAAVETAGQPGDALPDYWDRTADPVHG